MGIKFGEVDASQILMNEFSIGVLEGIVQWILENNENLNKPSQRDIKEIQSAVTVKLKAKYPKSGIELKES